CGSPLFGGMHSPQLRRAGAIDRAVRGQSDAVVALGGFARDQPVGDIGRDLVGVARPWVAEAAAARQFEPDEIAARHGLPAFRADRLAGTEGDAAGCPFAAAIAAARRVINALEIA